jgi:hypothetical protein
MIADALRGASADLRQVMHLDAGAERFEEDGEGAEQLRALLEEPLEFGEAPLRHHAGFPQSEQMTLARISAAAGLNVTMARGISPAMCCQ